MTRRSVRLLKPKALRKGSKLAVVCPSSPADPAAISAGIAELLRLGFLAEESAPLSAQGYFAGAHKQRLRQFQKPFKEKSISGAVAARGGYGANYLIDLQLATSLIGPKCLIGFSDLNIIQLLLLESRQWAGFYGPMVAAGFARRDCSRSQLIRPHKLVGTERIANLSRSD